MDSARLKLGGQGGGPGGRRRDERVQSLVARGGSLGYRMVAPVPGHAIDDTGFLRCVYSLSYFDIMHLPFHLQNDVQPQQTRSMQSTTPPEFLYE